ncbi:MAG: hypothetical protein NC320_03070 [Clostridium sp.]|nr:hypothetical protein [Clostridium sp.]
MKIYIKSATEPIYIDIVVEFSGSIIEGAKTVPVGKMNLTPQERVDFTDFIEDVGELMETFEFEIMEEHPSRYTDSASYYYTFYPTDSDYDVCYENLYFLRISTHERQSRQRNPFPKYYPETAQKYKRPKDKKENQSHRKIEVIVNGDHYDDYDDAFEAIKKKFLNLQKKCDKLNRK